MEECGMNGVKNNAMENAVSKARTHARLRRLDSHQVRATSATPMLLQIQGVRMGSIMDNA
jgi:hypothetical protein